MRLGVLPAIGVPLPTASLGCAVNAASTSAARALSATLAFATAVAARVATAVAAAAASAAPGAARATSGPLTAVQHLSSAVFTALGLLSYALVFGCSAVLQHLSAALASCTAGALLPLGESHRLATSLLLMASARLSAARAAAAAWLLRRRSFAEFSLGLITGLVAYRIARAAQKRLARGAGFTD